MPPLAVCAVTADDHVGDVVALARELETCGAFTPRYLHVMEDVLAPPMSSDDLVGSFEWPFVPRGVRVECVRGRAAAQLDQRAQQLGAALLVVGSRGRGPLAAALFGSVSRRLLTTGTLPVVVAPQGSSADGRDGPLVCGISGPPEHAGRVSRAAAGLARRMDRPLLLATAVVPPRATLRPDPVRALDDARALLQGVSAWLDVPAGIDMTILHDVPGAGLAGLGDDLRAPLIVVGCRGNGILGTMVGGSVSLELIRDAGRPVAVVPLHATPAR